jgi:iron complex outermembrane recepter protein
LKKSNHQKWWWLENPKQGEMRMKRKLGSSLSMAATVLLISSFGMSPAIAEESGRVLEEIVVTATKRASNLQDVPISVGVVTGEFINTFDIKDMSDIQNFVPGLQVQQTFGSWAVRIRGLGSGITNLAFDSSVPIYIDDVYCGRGKCLESALLDVERLEVARGPQGALFGKSTIAGAISAVSARPTEEFEAELRVGGELEYGGYTTSGYVSGPMSDSVRARLAVRWDDLDGYTDNIFLNREDGDKQTKAARLGFEIDAGDATTFYLKLETGKSETEGRNNQLVSPGAMTASTTDPNLEFRSDDRRSVSTGVEREDFYDYQWNSVTLSMDTALGEHSLEGTLGYWEYDNEWFLDVDGHPEAILNTYLEDEYEQSTAEIRLLSPTNQRFEYIVGAWYQDSDLTTRQFSPFYPLFWQAVLPPFLQGAILPVASGMDRNFARESEAYSVYGQLTWNISERLRAIVDVRYTDEEQEGVGASWPIFFTGGTFDPERVAGGYFGHDPEYLFTQDREDDSVDPSIRIQYDVNDAMMVYAVYAEGSKAGGMKANDSKLGLILLGRAGDADFLQRYLGVSSITPADVAGGLNLEQGNGIFDFEDEEAESYELGMKTSLFNDSATLAVALFTTEFTNLQTSNYDGTQFIIGNAGSATVDGVEVEFSWQATDNLRLHSSVSFIDAEYDDFADAQCVVNSAGLPANSDCISGTENQKGEKLERSPDTEFNLSAIWQSQLTDNIRLKASASFYYSDEYFVQPTQADYSTQDSFTKWDARIALASNDERWEVGVTGRNLGDEMTIQHAYNIAGSEFRNLGIGRSVTLEAIFRI